MRHKVRQGVSRLQIFEHGAGHAGIGNEDVDVADFAADLGGNGLKIGLGGDVPSYWNDGAVRHRINCEPGYRNIVIGATYFGNLAASSFNGSSRRPTTYILCAPFSARAVAIIFPIPSRAFGLVSNGQGLFVKEPIARWLMEGYGPVPPPVTTATRPSILNKVSTRRVLSTSSIADGMLNLWKGSSHEVMTSFNDANTS